jgi:ribokinase
MKILNYGSLNIDMVFSVPHFVQGGETLASTSMMKSAGGKGANQSAALGKAGCPVYHAGKVGQDGRFLVDLLSSYGVDTRFIRITDRPSGQAIIQLDEHSQNAIILLPGENMRIGRDEIDETLAFFGPGDLLVLQNEINEISYLIERAYERHLSICLNPAPFDASVFALPLDMVDMLIVNEIEGAALAKAPCDTSFEKLLSILSTVFPATEIILTAGKGGAYYAFEKDVYYQAIIDKPVVDTTAAGDTFIGYFLASRLRGLSVPQCLLKATLASSYTISRVGAMESIPCQDEVFG